MKEILITIEIIPYKTFKEKIKVTKKLKNCKIEVHKDFILVERINEVFKWL